MKFINAILALYLASLSLAAPANEPRQGGVGGKPCSSLRPIEYELDHTQHRPRRRWGQHSQQRPGPRQQRPRR